MDKKALVFDFGGVLMDWNPRYYFSSHFESEETMEFFLSKIASDEWNAQQDKGRSLSEATELLVAMHPDWEADIRAYYQNWSTMLKGEIKQNVEVLRRLAQNRYPLYGLTNWSHETFPYALEHYDFFSLFEGKIVVSGEEKLIKPDPEIFQLLIERYSLDPKESIFIDDNYQNILTAEKLGFDVVHVHSELELSAALAEKGIVL